MNASETKFRADKGGELGVNGEWYEGGQFLPSTTLPKMQKQQGKKYNKTHKIEIEPYKWVEANKADSSIMTQFGIFMIIDWENGIAKPTYNQNAYAHYGKTNEQIEKVCERFNGGERILKNWFSE